jgi:hypothetical protein
MSSFGKKVHRHLLFESAVKAVKLLRKNQKYFLYIVLADLLFIFVNGFLSFGLINRLQEYLFAVAGEIASRSSEISQEVVQKSIFEVLFSYPEIGSLISSIIGLLLLIIITIYIVFNIFQGYAWKTSLRIIGKPVSYYKFCTQFVIVNILWLILFYSQRIFVVIVTILNTLSEKVYHTSPSFVLDYFGTAFLIAIIYFAVISYSLIGRFSVAGILKRTFSFGIKRLVYFVPMYAIIAAMFWIINFILGAVGGVNRTLFFIVGFLLVFPVFAFSRVYIALIVNKLVK